MSTHIAAGWDAYNAINGATVYPYPAGGRVFSFGGLPWLFNNTYRTNRPTLGVRLDHFIVDICKWLLGGRSFGTIAIPTDNLDAVWYSSGNEPIIGTAAQAALTAAGFTLTSYSGDSAAPISGGANIVAASYPGQQTGSITALRDYVAAGGAVLAGVTFYNQLSNAPLYFKGGIGTAQAVFNGLAYVGGWVGAEAIFDRFNPGVGDSIPCNAGSTWYTGNTGTNAAAVGLGYSYPDSRWIEWQRPAEFYSACCHYAAYTIHADAGVGDNWATGV